MSDLPDYMITYVLIPGLVKYFLYSVIFYFCFRHLAQRLERIEWRAFALIALTTGFGHSAINELHLCLGVLAQYSHINFLNHLPVMRSIEISVLSLTWLSLHALYNRQFVSDQASVTKAQASPEPLKSEDS